MSFADAVKQFNCRDTGVGDFLINRAIEFDKRNVARTYLLLEKEAFERSEFIIAAYFTLANKPLTLGNTLSKSTIKEIDGFSKEAVSVGSIILGQLGKNENIDDNVSGSEIMKMVFEQIPKVTDVIGGRIMFLECQNSAGLIAFYERNGFSYLQKNESSGLLQFVRRL